jgi:hypothetical protein
MCQKPISGKTQEPDARASERGSELDEQIFRLQCLIAYLLEKNEELRHRLATGPREGKASLANHCRLVIH